MDTAVRVDDQGVTVDRETIAIAVVDVILLTGLIMFGQSHHGSLGGPLATLERVAPFLIGWFAMALLAGLYTRVATRSLVETIRITALTWIAAANIGLALRSSPYFEGGFHWTFSFVITGFGLLALVSWRFGYIAMRRS
ncbi:DUF3054 domain-containing protein [Natrialba taiwanensis]|uniref:DUF3054 domain-containing protein n=1 Tax=Natrialba taiwanensis DSM 12281 TaxID=1230458 RepID=M0ABR8_9EURY|nr:DUF3054 domain-containing protein [Natrialba taiwanensis]ELY95969.1 hypothetical protein C484_03239 [Natrialba taiwanensis DSM 12281]